MKCDANDYFKGAKRIAMPFGMDVRTGYPDGHVETNTQWQTLELERGANGTYSATNKFGWNLTSSSVNTVMGVHFAFGAANKWDSNSGSNYSLRTHLQLAS